MSRRSLKTGHPIWCSLASALVALLLFTSFSCREASAQIHPQGETLRERFVPPAGYVRTPYEEDSFAEYIRSLALKPHGSAVHLYNGKLKNRQDVHAAIFDISVGENDLQQCADAVMRIRADYLYSHGRDEEIAFDITNGERVEFRRFLAGERPSIVKNKIRWRQKMNPGSVNRQEAYRAFLHFVYSWGGSYSLSREVRYLARLSEIRPGDLFIRGGFPGHAVLVVDRAENSKGEVVILLAQSYMPAQEIHVLKNPLSSSPWYLLKKIAESGELITPEWRFEADELARFPGKLH